MAQLSRGEEKPRPARSEDGAVAWLRRFRRRWAALVQGGTAVLGIVGTFVLPPPVSMTGAPSWQRLAQFVAAVLIALMFLGTRQMRSRRPALWWWVAFGSLGLAVLAALGYDHLTRAWSCRYDDTLVIVGDEYTPQGREHRHQDPGAPCETLIQDFAGRVEDIWLSEGIRGRQSMLVAVYVGAVALFTICIVTVVEAIARADRPLSSRIRSRGASCIHDRHPDKQDRHRL